MLAPLSGLMSAQFASGLSATVVATAVPTVVTDLAAPASVSTWLIAATILGNTASAAIWGRLCDLLARRTVLVAAITVFVTGSVLAVLAPQIWVLLIARAVQGIGLGGIGSTVLVVAAGLVAPRDRGRVNGLLQSTMTTAMVLGPLVGGAVVEWAGWRWCFAVSVPFAVASIVLVGIWLREVPRIRLETTETDYLGAVLAATGLPACLISLTLATSGAVLWAAGFAAFGIAALGMFVRSQTRIRDPLVPVRLLRHRTLALTTVAALCFGSTLFGGTVFATQYLQWGLGFGPAVAGLLLAPMAVGTIAASWVAGRSISLSGHLRPVLVTTGVLLLAGNIAMALANIAPVVLALAGSLLISAGTGLGLPNLVLAGQTLAPPDRIGSVSSMISLVFTLGGTVGLVGYGAALDLRVTALLAGGASSRAAYAHGLPVVFLLAAAVVTAGLLAVTRLPPVTVDPSPGVAGEPPSVETECVRTDRKDR
ncbi:MFS transporter [Nocardia jinanensis]|uniref:EmrB/QacA family drug resistance transporter n=1 Tax=Nocardia jinanensis TaxID=382504 RepID=A0A917RD93_9NOCA|nr:MFS transporter [Nocardia jinanensis]GGL02317.1 EmrB/QacA family drug resistance transporter [Nocardia jinanensis]